MNVFCSQERVIENKVKNVNLMKMILKLIFRI